MPFYFFVFFILALIFFDKAITARLIFIERDLAGFFIPPKYLWVSLVKSFQLPLWNPYNYSGIPLLATLQPGIFYPPHILYLFLPFPIVWNYLIILHFVFSGITVFLFLRYLKASNAACFVGGVVFMLSGYLLSVHNLLPHLFSVSWFPLVLMFFLRYLEALRVRYLAYTSLCLTMQFLAGAPEIVMMTALVLILIAVFYPLFSHEVSHGIFKRCFALFYVLFLFILLSSVQFLPFFELSSQSIRKTGLSYHEAVTWSFAWKDFIQFFLPNPYGYLQSDAKYWANQSWLKTVYLGIAPFILSIFYFISKDRKKWLFIVLIVISFIFALGGNTPFYKILFHIPPFNSVRYPVKFLFVFFFIIGVTSGLGFDRLKQGIKDRDLKTQRIIKAIFYVGFIFAIAWGYVNLFNQDVKDLFERYNIKPNAFNDIDFNIHNIKRFLLFSFFFCIMLLISLRIKYKKIAFFSLVTILTADLFLANYGYYQLDAWKDYMKKHSFEEKMGNEKKERYIVTPMTKETFKLYPEDRMAMGPAYAAIKGLYTESGMEVLRIADYEIFTNMLYATKTLQEAKRFFDISGIGYIISAKEINESGFEFLDSLKVKIIRPKKDEKEKDEKQADEETLRLYRYKEAPGRFLLYQNAIFVKDIKTAIEKMEDKAIDLRSHLIIIDPERNPLDTLKNTPSEKDEMLQGSVTILSYKPNRIELRCESEKDAYLYVTDTFYPGWKAFIDGMETKIYRANLAFRAIRVQHGRHEIVFKYVPVSFYAGLLFTIFGIIFLLYLIRKK